MVGVKVVATTSLHLSHSYLPQSPSSSTIPFPPHGRRTSVIVWGTNLHRFKHGSHSSTMSRQRTILTRASVASLDTFSDDEFSKRVQEIVMRFHLSEEPTDSEEPNESESTGFDQMNTSDLTEIPEECSPANIELKVNGLELPQSLRLIRRKMQWREAGQSAYCSVKKAFSSMVFIIRELHSFTLQMREKLLYEDHQDIILRVQKEMHASFVWLFQQVFSHTPTLMMYVMILLANYSVHSMAANASIVSPPSYSTAAETESMSTTNEQKNHGKFIFDSSTVKTFSVSSSNGKTTSIGGNKGGGGGKYRPVTSGTEGDGESTKYHRTELPNGTHVREDESISVQDGEMKIWNSMVNEAAAARETVVDQETLEMLVSPVTAEIEPDRQEDYNQTELLYQMGLAQDPNNSLLLANYAQFLYLVIRDYKRSEEYFMKASTADPVDAEALNKYATFLWKVKMDLWAAEETYQKAISADPTNSYYSANYAHFLWNTGGHETCYPLNSDD